MNLDFGVIKDCIADLDALSKKARQNYSDSCSTVWVEQVVEDDELGDHVESVPKRQDDGWKRMAELCIRLSKASAELSTILIDFEDVREVVETSDFVEDEA